MEAHREGRLVLFVGAGVSRDFPSSLPSFECLVYRVADRLGVVIENPCREEEAEHPRSAEEILEEFEKRGLNVHGAVREIISDSREHNPTHEAVAGLAKAEGKIRLVTTNYDTHISACLSDDVSVYEAPDVPGTAGFEGVVHIHGSVDQTPEHLVVTRDDFARTYLNPDHSTLPFLHKLFASHTVLFIGYSLSDTLMQYIVKAVWEGSNLYALTKESDLTVWADHGITAVGYPSHRHLLTILNEWAERAGASFSEHDRRVSRILSHSGTSEDLTPWDESYLLDIVSDPERVRIFTKNARGPVWFRWVGSRAEMVNLFTPGAKLDSCQKVLVYWFWRHYLDDEETAAEMLGLIVRHGIRLNETLWLNLTMQLTGGFEISSQTATRLMLVLAETAPRELDNVVLGLLNLCETPRDDSLFLELVDRVFRPKVTPSDPSRHSGIQPGPFLAESTDPSDGWLRQGLEQLWSERRGLADELLKIVDVHLSRLHQIESVSGNLDPFADRATIAPSNQNFDLRSRGFLVDAARDLYEIVAQDLPQEAARWRDSWAKSRWVVLNRLAIHGWIHSDATPDDKIDWLLRQDDWVSDERMHHEAMQLIAGAVPEASETIIGALIDQILEGSDPCHAQVMFDKLTWIATHAPSSAKAERALAQISENHPDLEVSDHPAFLWRVDDSPEEPLPRYIDGTDPRDLAKKLIRETKATATELLAMFEEGDAQEQALSQQQRVISTVRKATELYPTAGLGLLEALTQDASSQPETRCSLASAVLTELVKTPPTQHPVGEQSRETGSLINRLWDTATTHWAARPDSPQSDRCLQEAPKLWPELLTTYAIVRITAQVNSEAESPHLGHLQDIQFLKRITAGNSIEARIAQATSARHLRFLHTVDRQWVNQNILPMLDPTDNIDQAVRCWDSYLHNWEFTPDLLGDGLMTQFKAFARYADCCCEETRRMFALLAAGLCSADAEQNPEGPPEWLNSFSADASKAIRTEFIRSTARLLNDTDQATKTAEWHRWMRKYWQRRIKGLPQHCTAKERSALVEWVSLLDEDFPTAVDMAVEVPTSLQNDSMWPDEWYLSIARTGSITGPFSQHPDATAKLIAHVLENTDVENAQRWEIPLVAVVNKLQHRTSAAALGPVREQLLRLGWNYAIQGQDPVMME